MLFRPEFYRPIDLQDLLRCNPRAIDPAIGVYQYEVTRPLKALLDEILPLAREKVAPNGCFRRPQFIAERLRLDLEHFLFQCSDSPTHPIVIAIYLEGRNYVMMANEPFFEEDRRQWILKLIKRALQSPAPVTSVTTSLNGVCRTKFHCRRTTLANP